MPGGRAAYPSTVLMTAIPARVAGVAELVLCVPPGPDGRVPAATLAAAALVGVDEVYRVGGAQAIAALAYGTETIRPVDVIVGPGNTYVAVAKREVAGVVGIESFAGPSEVVVVADGSGPPPSSPPTCSPRPSTAPVAPRSSSPGTPRSPTPSTARRTLAADAPRRAEIEATLRTGGRAVLVDDAVAALEAVNVIAPEHLELITADPEALVPLVRNAGAVFFGPWSPAALGDYVAGVNHVLPDRAHRAIRQCAAGRHLPQARPRGPCDRGRPRRARAQRRALRRGRGARRARRSVELRQRCAQDRAVSAPVRHATTCARSRATTRRSSTCRCGSTPTRARSRRRTSSSTRGSRRCAPRRSTAIPTASAPRLRDALGAQLGQPAERMFCANGSNEVLQTLLLTYGGAGRSAAVFEPTYALHSHIARITGTEVVVGERRADFTVDPAAARALLAEHRPDDRLRVQPQQPHRDRRARGHGRGAARRGRRPGRRRRGLRRVRDRSALELVADDRPLVVVRTYSKVWSMAALRLGFAVAPPWVVEELEKVVLPYHLALGHPARRALALDYGGRDGRARRPAWCASVSALEAELDRSTASRCYPSGANFVLLRAAGDGHALWQRLVDRGVLVRDFSRWPRLDDCLRVTVGTPEENDTFLAALREAVEEVRVA